MRKLGLFFFAGFVLLSTVLASEATSAVEGGTKTAVKITKFDTETKRNGMVGVKSTYEVTGKPNTKYRLRVEFTEKGSTTTLVLDVLKVETGMSGKVSKSFDNSATAMSPNKEYVIEAKLYPATGATTGTPLATDTKKIKTPKRP